MRIATYSKISCYVQQDMWARLTLPRLSPQAVAVCLICDPRRQAGLQSRAPSYFLSCLPLRHILTDNGLSSVHSPFLITRISHLHELNPAPCLETRSESGFSPPEDERKRLDCRCCFAQLGPRFQNHLFAHGGSNTISAKCYDACSVTGWHHVAMAMLGSIS